MLFVILLLFTSKLTQSQVHVKFESELEQVWVQNSGARANVLLRMHENSERKRTLESKRTSRERWKRIQSIVFLLKLQAQVSQKSLLHTVTKYPTEYDRITQLWITNTLSIENATMSLITLLADYESVRSISLDSRIPFQHDNENAPEVEITTSGTIVRNDTSPSYWGLDRTHVKQAHDRLQHRGEGIVIGIIDTGVSIEHQAFNQSNLLRWKDAAFDEKHPYDDDSHGTHVTAKLVGRDGIAPGAKYVVCNAFDGHGTTERLLTACSQFMLCPDDDTCRMTPQVINNSWNLNKEESEKMAPIIDAWEVENIIAVASAGNRFHTASCDNLFLTAPATFTKVISVGALAKNNRLAYFSRQAVHSKYKLDIVAPGHAIQSAHARIMDEVIERNGTSLAAPFVTGTIALFLAEAKRSDRQLSRDDIYDILTNTACTNVLAPEIECGSFHTGYGHGVLNADAALTHLHTHYLYH